MQLKEQIQELQNNLKAAGYQDISGLLDMCTSQSTVFKIGVVGDCSTGKSSIINSLIGYEILKTSIIPSETVITIKKGVSDGIVSNEGELISLDSMEELMEKESYIEVACSSEFVDNKEIIEFPGLISKTSIENIQLMKDLYMCDAAILVISADHMLSEAECLFIENFSKYVDEKRLFVEINKLDLIEPDDITRVFEFAFKQMNSRFPNVKWDFLQKDLLPQKQDSGIGVDELKNVIETWVSEDKQLINENSLVNIKQYIKQTIELDLNKLKEESSKDAEQRKVDAEQSIQEKKLEKVRLENILLEFEGKCSQSLKDIDCYLSDIFTKMEQSILHKFDSSNDKYTWYKKELPRVWNSDLENVASEVDQYVLEIINKDVEWLNSQSVVCAEADFTIADLLNQTLANDYQGKPYGMVKKYIPLGIGGSVVVGFRLWRIVGASVCLLGGFFFKRKLDSLDEKQNEEIKVRISNDIEKISVTSRKISGDEIRKAYVEIKDKYKNNVHDFLDKKYVVMSESEDFSSKIVDLEQIMRLL